MADASDTMHSRTPLFRRFILMLAPATVIFGGWAVCRQAGLAPQAAPPVTSIVGPATFIVAIILAVALPLLYRISFVRKVEGQKNVKRTPFLAFQLNLMTIALATPYAAAAGYVAGVATFHFAGAFLASLYAVYYYFPSEKRMKQEMRLFRVIPD